MDGYYAIKKGGKTLFSFEWSVDDQLFIVDDKGKKTMVDKTEYEILNISVVTADSNK